MAVERLHKGATIGRYTILGPLDHEQADLYVAYDPNLDRKVALKLLDSGRSTAEVREARSIAGLDHANVIAIQDVATDAGRVVVTFEHVPGSTFDRWLAVRPRTWREIVDVLLAAGHGLGAAHEAGLVHGQFGTDSVLVGDDGRTRITDFGLGAKLDESSGPSADQRAFCRVLSEALVRSRRVPGWLRRVARRDHPSMAALVTALAYAPRVRHQRFIVGAAAVAVGAVAITLLVVGSGGHTEPPKCEGAAERLAGIWDDARRQLVREAFAKIAAPFSDTTWRRSATMLDGYATQWAAMYEQACLATHSEDGSQSTQILDLRMECLGRRSAQLRAVTGLFIAADHTLVTRARDVLATLEPIAGCADVVALSAAVPPPRDPDVKRRVDELRARMDEGDALRAAGKDTLAGPILREIADEARRIEYLPFKADALYELGLWHSGNGDGKQAEALLREALADAEAGGDDMLKARVWVYLVFIVGETQVREAEALEAARYAEATLTRIGGDEQLSSQLDRHRGEVLANMGRYAEARIAFERALAARERGYGPDDPGVANIHESLATLSNQQGKFADAVAEFQKVVAIRERAFGAEHPDISGALSNLGMALAGMGRFDEAAKNFERSLAMAERTRVADHHDAATTRMNLGLVTLLQGRAKESIPIFEQALATQERVLGVDHPRVARTLGNLGEAHRTLRDYSRAVAVQERALRIIETRQGKEHIATYPPLAAIGWNHLDRNAPQEAIAPLERALAVLPPDHAPHERAQVRYLLARALWRGSRERVRAEQLMREARTLYAEAGEGFATDLKEVDAWLAGARKQ